MTLLYFCLVWLVAGLMTGLTSFGSNLIAVPLITLVFDARDSILIGCLSAAIIFLGLACLYRKSIVWKDALILVLGAFAGMPCGIWFLKNAGSRALLLAAAFSLLLFLLWQVAMVFLRHEGKEAKRAWAIPLGLISGVLMGSVGMGGPPLVIYIFLRKYNKEQTIATINAASVGIILGVLPWQYAAGLYSEYTMRLGLVGGGFGLLGIACSIPFIKRIKINIFRNLLLGMIALSALILFWRGI